MWPGLVGKGPDSEPPIDLDTMQERQFLKMLAEALDVPAEAAARVERELSA